MDWENGFGERDLWRWCLPDWAITLFLAPFADEVGARTATLYWAARCLTFSVLVVALLPESLLDPVASGAVLGAAAVMIYAAICTAMFP